MGVDYSGVGGVGILITEDMAEQLCNKYEVGLKKALERCGIAYTDAGDGCYGGEDRFYFCMGYNTLVDCWENAQVFIDSINCKLGTSLTIEDLIIIEDLCVW